MGYLREEVTVMKTPYFRDGLSVSRQTRRQDKRARKRSGNLPLFSVFMALALVLAVSGCAQKKPILVGFSGQLTGPHADMGVSGRDGVQLAIDRINADGGIAGRQVELVVRDDKGTAEGARAADQELIDAGVVAIVGHMTSSQSIAALPVLEEAGVVLLSPTTSAPALTGQVDHFFRVIAASSTEARFLAQHVVQGAGIERVAAIYDEANAAFTEPYLDAFRDELRELGGQMVGVVSYSSDETTDFGPLVSQLRAADPQGLIIITSAYDAALVAQQPRLFGWETRLFGCGWACSAPLIEHGGKSAEGMSCVTNYDLDSQASDFVKFQEHYQAQFEQPPSFMAVFAYEAVLVLAAALEKTDGQAKGLAQALPGTQVQGLVETVSLDQYGDVVRDPFLITVQDGRFVTKGRVGQ
jgi:branched-chain amino acid transport system substrate-binding protein